ncbi:MAG: ABC transporter permease [Chloroflexota bacterium]
MYHLRLIGLFARASFLEESAYRANFFLSVVYSLLNLLTGVLAIVVLFGQVTQINGWEFNQTLALLGVYLTLGALRSLVFGPSLDSMAGMDGEIWSGRLDFSLMRPLNTQFLVSFRKWRYHALFDLALGFTVILIAAMRLHESLAVGNLLSFLLALGAGLAILYAILLAFSALAFFSPGVMFTWVFDGVFQMARYPLGLYPRWLQWMLTWIVPVGVITTLPAQALNGAASPAALAGMLVLALLLCSTASLLFRYGLRQYKSASS